MAQARVSRKVAKSPARAKRARAKSARSGAAFAFTHDPALEAAIIDAPLEAAPRMVYADWLQAAGDTRGEWMALCAAMEADPKNVRLRSLVVDFLGEHRELLLGEGASLLPGAWIGWRGGFIDELRVQPYLKQRGAGRSFAALLAHPSCRFVRHVALGELPRLQDAIDALSAAAPPLLETVVVIDAEAIQQAAVDLDGLCALPTLRRLGLNGASIERPMPQLVELSLSLRDDLVRWVIAGGCANLTELTLDCADAESPRDVGAIVRALPALTRLRLLDLRDADAVIADLGSLRGRLQLLDLTGSSVTDQGGEQLASWPDLELVALRTVLSESLLARLATRLRTVMASRRTSEWQYFERDYDPTGLSWFAHRLATDGRDGLRAMPGIGRALFNIGTRHSTSQREEVAVPLLDASLTFPNRHLKTWAWANAAIAHERMRNFDDCELIAREGMLRVPHEPNLFAIVIDVLRRTDRLDQALALLPRAIASITRAPGLGAHTGGPACCLADCLLVLQQAGRHVDVIRLAERHEHLLQPRTHACVAMSLVALGRLAEAKTTMKLAKQAKEPIRDHAIAVMALAQKSPNRAVALAALARAKAADYPEWHWIPRDPNLAALFTDGGAATPELRALLETPVVRVPVTPEAAESFEDGIPL